MIMNCQNCMYWMPLKEKCGECRTADKYQGKRFCRHWRLNSKIGNKIIPKDKPLEEFRRLELS